jgi:protein-disulfide isomerase
MKTAALLLLSCAAFAQVKTPPKPAPAPAQKSAFDKATLEAYLRNVELFQPIVTAKIDDAKPSPDVPGFFDVWVHWSANGATKDELVYVSKDGKKVIQGNDVHVFDVNRNPFQANLDKLKVDNQPTLGPAPPANAPISLVVFSDFECPICKEEAQILREQVAKQFADKVRIYFMDFPLDSIHPWAHAAALAGRCVYNQSPGAFWDYFDWVYENQQEIKPENFNAKFQAFATDQKLDGIELGRCVENKGSEPDVTREIAVARSLQLAATPTLFLNGRKLEGGIPWQTLEQLINIELDRQTKAAAADEKCCEISMPKIGK